MPAVWNTLTAASREWVLDEESGFAANGPQLQDEWLNDSELRERSLDQRERRLIVEETRRDKKPSGSVPRCSENVFKGRRPTPWHLMDDVFGGS